MFKDLDTILEHAEDAKNKRVREGLKNGKDLVYLSRELVTIHCDVPIEFHLDELARSKMDVKSLISDFQDMEMYSLISQVEALSGNKQVISEKPNKKYEHILISIKKDSNLNKLILKIKSKLKNKFTTTEDILITRERHRQNLINCVQHLEKFQKKKSTQDFDKAAEDLRLATRHLGMIVGKVDVEELLGSIFNDFCIGK